MLLLSHFSCVQFFATLWTVAHEAPLSNGFSKKEYWSGLPCPPPGDQTRISLCLLHWQMGSLPLVPPGKPLHPGYTCSIPGQGSKIPLQGCSLLSLWDQFLLLSRIFSRFIQEVAVSIFHFFYGWIISPLYVQPTIYLSINSVMDIWAVPTFCLLWILLQTFLYKFLCRHIFSFLLNTYLRVESYGNSVYLFEEPPNHFT